MVSRRNFFSITIMMAVLFFMFQFSQALKNQGNIFDVNVYAEKERPTQKKAEGNVAGTEENEDIVLKDKRPYVIFVGKKGGNYAETVKEWSTYAKRGFKRLDSIADLNPEEEAPELIFLDNSSFDQEKDTAVLKELAQTKKNVFVFCGAPEMAELKKNPELSALMGVITEGENKAHTLGYEIFPEFLLGGDIIYKEPERMKKDKAAKIQDLSYDMQWYRTGAGTKTYMVGIMDEKETEKELFPAVIWRNSFGKSQIYVVTGGFLQGAGGFGVIDGILYEASDYLVYPVVNARSFSLLDYPSLASENEEKLQGLYARDQVAIQRDLFWPNLIALIKREKLKPTCIVNVQQDYTDNFWPQSADVDFYLQQLKELDGEAGWSLREGKGIGLPGKITSDAAFFEAVGTGYKYAATYTDRITEEFKESLSSIKGAADISTVLTLHKMGQPYLSYLSENVTLQTAVDEALEYTYSKDFEIRGLLSALGYGSVVLDMHSVIWPVTAKDQWETFANEATSYISSFWNQYKGFERTTLSLSDYRIRNFLNLSYTEERKKNQLKINVTDSDDSWFVLRTHGEEIESIEGASFEKLEENVFLLHITKSGCTVTLKTSDQTFQF